MRRDPFDIDELIAAEGVEHLAQIIHGIYQSESGSGAADTSGVNYADVTGPMQVQRATFDGLKRNGLLPPTADWHNPRDNALAGIKVIESAAALPNVGISEPRIRAVFYGGPKAVRPDGTIVAGMRDLKNPSAPTVGEYVDRGKSGFSASLLSSPATPAAGLSAPLLPGQTKSIWADDPAPAPSGPSVWSDTGEDMMLGDEVPQPGLLASIGHHAIGGLAPAAAGLAAGIPGAEAGAVAGGMLGPLGSAAGAIVGGLVTGLPAAWVTGKLQDKLFEENPQLAEALSQDAETRRREEEANPYGSMLGSQLANLAAFRPSLAGLGNVSRLMASGDVAAAGAVRAARLAGAQNAILGGGMEAYNELTSDQPVDLLRIGIATGVGALGQKETFLGRGLAAAGRAVTPGPISRRADVLFGRNQPAPEPVPEVAPQAPEQLALPPPAKQLGWDGPAPEAPQAPPVAAGEQIPLPLPVTPQGVQRGPETYRGAPPPEVAPEPAVAPLRGQRDMLVETPDATVVSDLWRKQAPLQTPDEVAQQIRTAMQGSSSPFVDVLARAVAPLNDRSFAVSEALLQDHEAGLQARIDALNGKTRQSTKSRELQISQIEREQAAVAGARQVIADARAKQVDNASLLDMRQQDVAGQAAAKTKQIQSAEAARASEEAAAVAAARDTRQQVTDATQFTDSVVQGAREQKTAAAREQIIQQVLDDNTTRNPIGRIRTELRKAGFRDLTLTESEQHRVQKFEEARDALQAQPQQTEMFSNQEMGTGEAPPRAPVEPPVTSVEPPREQTALMRARRSWGDKPVLTKAATGDTMRQLIAEADRVLAETKGAKSIGIMKQAHEAFLRDGDIERVRNTTKLLKARRYAEAERNVAAPPETADATEVRPQQEGVQSERERTGEGVQVEGQDRNVPPSERGGSQEAGTGNRVQPAASREVESLRELVKEAMTQGAVDRGTGIRLLHELTKPDPSLDMVRSTVARGAKRLEAVAKTRTPEGKAGEEPTHVRTPKQAPDVEAEQAAARVAARRAEIEARQRAEDEDAGRLRAGKGRGQGVDVETAQRAVDEHTAGWRNKSEVRVVKSVDDLPGDLRERAPSDTKGAFAKDGKLYVVADNARDASDVKATIFHEMLGHYGMQGRFGKALTDILARAYKTNPKIREAADAWIEKQMANRESRSYYSKLTPEQLQRVAVEEILAERSEAGATARGGLRGTFDKIVAAVRQFARARGMDVDYSDNDVAQILRKSHDFVLKGEGAPARPDERLMYTDRGGSPPRDSVTPTVEGVPVEERLRVGERTMSDDAHDRIYSMLDPATMARTPSDVLTNIRGATRRKFLEFMDMSWIADRFRKTLPQISRFNDILATKAADKASLVVEASKPYSAWRALPKAHAEEVGSLLLAGSDARVDVRTGEGGRKGVSPAEKQALITRYKALAPEAKAAFDGVRDTLNNQHQQIKQLMADAINRDTEMAPKDRADALAELDEKFKSIQGYFPLMRFGDFIAIGESTKYHDLVGNVDQLKIDLSKASTEQKPELQKQLTAAQDAMDREAENGGRSVEAFQTEAEMIRRVAEMKQQGLNARERLASEFNPRIDGVNTQFMNRINDALDAEIARSPHGSEGAKGVKSMLNQLYFSMMPEGSVVKRQMTRAGVKGYSEDAQRVYAAASRRNAGYISEVKHSYAAREVLDDIRVASARQGIKEQEVYNLLKKHYDGLHKYAKTPYQDFLSQASYAYMLGASPSFMVMHLMQTPLVTAPMLGGDYGFKATATLMNAFHDVGFKSLKAGNEHVGGKTPAEQAMFKYMVTRNVIDGTEAHMFINTGKDTTGPASAIGRAIMHGAGFFPKYTEKLNRLGTALAAHRLAIEDPRAIERMHITPEEVAQHNADHPDLPMTAKELAAARYAEKITLDSHVDYSKENAPYIMQQGAHGAIPTKLFFQFQKYQFGMIKMLAQNWEHMVDPSLSGAERRAAGKTLLGVLGSHALVTGAMGLPGFGLAAFAANVYHKFLGDKDDPFNAEVDFRNMVADHLGKDAGDVVSRGLLYMPGVRDKFPVDITDRLGMGDLVMSGHVVGKIDRNSLAQYIGSALGGPSASLMGNFTDAYALAHQGDYWKAAEQMVPKVFRDVAKTARFNGWVPGLDNPGVTTISGKRVVGANEITNAETAAQLAGFEPQRIEEAYAQRSAVNEAKDQLAERRKILIKQFAEAKLVGDNETTNAIMEKVKHYNEVQMAAGRISERLNISTLYQATQARRLENLRLKGGVSLTPKERALRSEYGGFSGVANEPAP